MADAAAAAAAVVPSLEDLVQKAKNLGLDNCLTTLKWIPKTQDKIRYLKQTIEAEEKTKQAEEKTKRLEQSLKQRILETRRLVAASIGSTYGIGSSEDGSDLKLRPIRINAAIKPSISGNTRKYRVANEAGEMQTIELKMPEVTIEEAQEMWLDVKEIKIPVKDADGAFLESSLGACRGTEFEYGNEFGVQSLCEKIVDDALRCLGLSYQRVKSHWEISIFNLRPDMVMVLKVEGKIFFAIEVKSPAEVEDGDGKPKADIVFTSGNAAGQIWSYLYGMMAAGNETPMGAIMTYNKMVIVSLEDYKSDDNHTKAVNNTKERLSTGIVHEQTKPEEEKVACAQRTESPTKATKAFSEYKKKNSEVQDNVMPKSEESEESAKRNVCYSRVHTDGEVFPCLLQAIQIAYEKTLDMSITAVPRVSNGEHLGGRWVFKISENSFNWVKLPETLKATVDDKVPDSRAQFFHVLGKLADGQTAAIYLACTIGGHVCAIKDYYIRESSAPTLEQRMEEDNKSRADTRTECLEEKARWDGLYDGTYKVHYKILGAKPTLLLPYGREIEVLADRWKSLPSILKELNRFAYMEGGYKYKASDLRWRHVLQASQDRIFLGDLASLVEVLGEEDKEHVVFEQLRILLQTMVKVEKEEENKAAKDEEGLLDPDSLESTLEWIQKTPKEVAVLIGGEKTLYDFFVKGRTEEYIKALFTPSKKFKDLKEAAEKGEAKAAEAVVSVHLLAYFRGVALTEKDGSILVPDGERNTHHQLALHRTLPGRESPGEASKIKVHRPLLLDAPA